MISWCALRGRATRTLCLTGWPSVGYAQRQSKRVSFVEMRMVLPLLDLVGNRTQCFRDGGTNPRPVSAFQHNETSGM
jgi:hypothetical protein